MMEQENFNEPFSGMSQTITHFFSDSLEKVTDIAFLSEVGIIVCIPFLSHIIHKVIKRRYLNYMFKEEETPSLGQRVLYSAISFLKPLIAFILFLIAMSVSSTFTDKLEIYKLAIKFTMIWFLVILAKCAIPDFFVRAVAFCTLLPLLIFSTLDLSAPVLSYLDSLSFNISGVRLSILLVLKTLLIATCLFWVARFISRTVSTLIDSQRKINMEIRDLMQNLFQIILYTTVTLMTLDIVGIDLKSLAIVGGAIGIGIGLGLQKIAANFVSGIIILFEQNIKVGHLVQVNGVDKPGWIRHLGARAAVIDTDDGKELLIPNEELLTKTVIDWTSNDRKIRTDLHVKVSFKSDLEKAKAILIEAVKSHPICSKRNPPSCYLEKFTDNGAEFLLQFWVDDLSVGKMDMQNDVLVYIWRRFSEENIEHPSPALLTQTPDLSFQQSIE